MMDSDTVPNYVGVTYIYREWLVRERSACQEKHMVGHTYLTVHIPILSVHQKDKKTQGMWLLKSTSQGCTCISDPDLSVAWKLA